MASHVYDSAFQNYTARISRSSAERTVAIVRTLLDVNSVLDVGCSAGTWLSMWENAGVTDYLGLDGDYVDMSGLRIPPERFHAHDLRKPFALGRRFDLVENLEVAEHLPQERAAGFTADLASHGSAVLFSAAPPGQGGEFHINEQPYEYWRALFAAQGMVMVDCLRPVLAMANDIAPWYRQNMFLFLTEDRLATLPAFARQFRVPAEGPIADVSPPAYRLRKAVLRRLPFGVLQILAKLAARAGVS